MKKKFEKSIDELKFIAYDDGVKYNFALSILRTLLSYAALGALGVVEADKEDSDLPLLEQSARKLSRPSNPYLFDRFAWFTMKNLRELDVAEKLAMHAFSLAPTDLEVSFTLGMIFARKGEVGDADKYLNISRTNGKERNLVLLQMAHARYTCAWKNGTLDGECGFAKINDLLSASKIGAPQTRVHNRHNDEIESLRAKVKNVFRRAGR